ncbi:divalent cation tolerance protein CutA [Cylindrospermopsis raciborskii CHAB3438]|uniref:divalent-cation tolerance protein CutA n=1 Tax=Cylindrospermopsis TaxID=77021 RepID=UPI00070F4925|nr:MULTISPECIES: divalent-cation tolerance protein CutA [Cylindrospermopsis]KRH97894.1 dihydroorotate dehydrogenase [Cylindrospermopsis sp. CR12]MBU6345513.1 divalent cation tolerance protein CutA [Cyanobacteria bacterium REEB494]MCH4904266.1 divalent cation tolerance protein CutA [Cylindrospermopsis raciborskii CHAB3438]TPX28735.1 divalent-cation tolerance protein CutA [Cylindrospermopsis raciborskii GIHE 2018]
MKVIFLYVTCKDRDEALSIGKLLVQERLVACANIVENMDSIYWWNGEVQVEKEAILIMKSRQDLFVQIKDKISSLHSYDTPCIVAMPIDYVSETYLSWLIKETKTLWNMGAKNIELL